jgi:hypothetical protein
MGLVSNWKSTLDSVSECRLALWIETHLFLIRTMAIFCLELTVPDRGSGVILREPKHHETDPDIQEQRIVELSSR